MSRLVTLQEDKMDLTLLAMAALEAIRKEMEENKDDAKD